MAYTPQIASASTDGRCVKIAATASPGTTLHTAVASATDMDEIYIWVSNSSAAAVGLTIEFGGTTNPDDRIVNTLSIPANSPPILIVPGVRLRNSLVVKAFASSANVLIAAVNVNRLAA